MNYGPAICQQCKEPLQLDASLIDLAPSTYDVIAATLPTPPSQASESFAPIPSSSSATKSVWQQSQNARQIQQMTPAFSHHGKQPQRVPSPRVPAPNESFILLQDSIIQNIPTQPPQSTNPKRVFSSSRRSAGNPSDEEPTAAFKPDMQPSPLSHHLRSAARIFNLLSSNTEIDHPLCAECTQTLLKSLQRQLEETKKERDGYIAFEKEIRREKEREMHDLKWEEAEKRVERLQIEEQNVMEQLKEAEREKEQLDEELRMLEMDEKALELEEAEFWRVHNEHLLVAEQQAAQLASLRTAYASDVATLEKLERTNVYNDAFCIGHDGIFGTINGLRLGRVPGIPVEWAEINAAWGQTLLLLYTMARKLDISFENYRLVPMGSFSRIEKTTGDKANYELYGSGDLHLGRLLHNRRFDIAMVAFLDCLKHFMDYIKSQDTSVDFPHQIIKDKIGDVSIKLQFNQEEAWTRSLRHVLLALKICLKWTTNLGNG